MPCFFVVARDRQDCPGIFHGHLVRLYADYAPHKLLSFLKSSDQYPIQEALGQTISTDIIRGGCGEGNRLLYWYP